MIEACSTLPPSGGAVGSMTSYLDCQAQILGSSGWQALASPGSSLSIVLTGFLTIFIALIGYNLLLGRGFTVREGTLAAIKIGAVFALATSWPAYRTLVYDLVTDGPGQIVAEIGGRSGIVGSDGQLVQRLDLADRAMTQLAILGPGNATSDVSVEVAPPPFARFDDFALGGSRILFLLGAVAGLSAIRIVAGLLLALGPFFIAFLLFDNTRSLFEGWVRVLAGTALASIAVGIALGLELGLLEPWLAEAIARRIAGEYLPAVATELFVAVCLFTIILIAALLATAKIARAFRLAPLVARSSDVKQPIAASNLWSEPAMPTQVRSERSRAAAMASSLVSVSRRDFAGEPGLLAQDLGAAQRTPVGGERRGDHAGRPAPLGRSWRRAAGSRVSARGSRRDGTA